MNLKYKIGDKVLVKGEIVEIGGDSSAPYRIHTELYIDKYNDLWGDDDDLEPNYNYKGEKWKHG